MSFVNKSLRLFKFHDYAVMAASKLQHAGSDHHGTCAWLQDASLIGKMWRYIDGQWTQASVANHD